MITENISDKVYGNAGNQDVLNLISPNAEYVLDVGCGSGSLARALQKRGSVVDGITISNAELQEAKPFLRNGYIQNLEDGLPAISTQYDVAVCSHVLEHICYPDKLLRDIHRVLNENGELIVALPNIMHYKARLQLMIGNFNYTSQGLWDYTHFRWYTFRSAKKLLESHGFLVQEAKVTGDLPLNSIFSKILPDAWRRRCYNMLTGISKGLFGYQLLYRATKSTTPKKIS